MPQPETTAATHSWPQLVSYQWPVARNGLNGRHMLCQVANHAQGACHFVTCSLHTTAPRCGSICPLPALSQQNDRYTQTSDQDTDTECMPAAAAVPRQGHSQFIIHIAVTSCASRAGTASSTYTQTAGISNPTTPQTATCRSTMLHRHNRVQTAQGAERRTAVPHWQ
jgi:hypothetical protein